MKFTNALKKVRKYLDAANVITTKDGGGTQRCHVHWKGRHLTFREDFYGNVTSIRICRDGDEDDIQTDYFAGSYYDNISQAIRSLLSEHKYLDIEGRSINITLFLHNRKMTPIYQTSIDGCEPITLEDEQGIGMAKAILGGDEIAGVGLLDYIAEKYPYIGQEVIYDYWSGEPSARDRKMFRTLEEGRDWAESPLDGHYIDSRLVVNCGDIVYKRENDNPLYKTRQGMRSAAKSSKQESN